MTIGILLHVYHLEAEGWERLVWGDPAQDLLGTGPKFAEFLLDTPVEATITSVIYSGPSQKDNLTEGAYTKQFLINRLDRLGDFPRLKQKLDKLTPQEYETFVQRFRDLQVGPVIENTVDEVAHAAHQFANTAEQVIQIASASHAPRCMKAQLTAKESGLLNNKQLWSVMASDTYFSGTTAKHIIVIEPPHRGDDPMKGFHPTLSEALQPYFSLSPDGMRRANETIRKATTPDRSV